MEHFPLMWVAGSVSICVHIFLIKSTMYTILVVLLQNRHSTLQAKKITTSGKQ